MNTPTLESLSTIRTDGSRKFVYPADARGKFMFWRRIVAVLLMGVYIALPWIPVNGYPAVFLDVQGRRFHFFGLTLATQDLWVGFFLITGLAFSLFYVTALFGRIWCGWACPYTVFLEHVYRRIERWVEGDAAERRHRAEGPLTWGKAWRLSVKHSLYLLCSALIAHLFLSYFVSLKALYAMMRGSPAEHLSAFGIVVFLTGMLYFSFAWFREQFCIILCPYGRLQSALTDDHSMVVGYDARRGEPRGKMAAATGDCVDCRRCVQVCPTGIDIRNGLQLECIGCAACIDACDSVMTRLKRPTGLIRHDSHVGLRGGKTRLWRPRIWFYSFLLALGALAFGISAAQITPLKVAASRMVGAPYYLGGNEVRNQFLVRLINKRNEPVSCKLELEGPLPPALRATGLEEVLQLPALGEEQKAVILSMPDAAWTGGFKLRVKITDTQHGNSTLTGFLEFLGPDPRLKNDVPLHVQDFIQ